MTTERVAAIRLPGTELAVTDVSAVVGGVAWLAALLLGGLGPIDRALALLASLLWPGGRWGAALLAAPWLVVTGLLGLTALSRVERRGPRPLAETAVDAGLAYISVGAVALVFSHLGITLWFESVVEVLAVGGFTAAVAALGGYVVVRVAPSRPRTQGVLLAASALALPVSMLLAVGYAVSVFAEVDLGLGLGTMVALHGSLNAFGFGLLAMVGWRLAVPNPRD